VEKSFTSLSCLEREALKKTLGFFFFNRLLSGDFPAALCGFAGALSPLLVSVFSLFLCRFCLVFFPHFVARLVHLLFFSASVHPAVLSNVHPAVQPTIHSTQRVILCSQSSSSSSMSPSSPLPFCPSLSSLLFLVVDFVCGGLNRVFSKPDLFSHVFSTVNRALPSSSPVSQLPFSSSRYVLPRRRPYPAPCQCFGVFLLLCGSFVLSIVFCLLFCCYCIFCCFFYFLVFFVYFILVLFSCLAAIRCYGGLEWVLLCSCGY
jgi:hypothetical protein